MGCHEIFGSCVDTMSSGLQGKELGCVYSKTHIPLGMEDGKELRNCGKRRANLKCKKTSINQGSNIWFCKVHAMRSLTCSICQIRHAQPSCQLQNKLTLLLAHRLTDAQTHRHTDTRTHTDTHTPEKNWSLKNNRQISWWKMVAGRAVFICSTVCASVEFGLSTLHTCETNLFLLAS